MSATVVGLGRALMASFAVGALLTVAGCAGGDGGRSVEAFCSTIRSEKVRILDQFETTSSIGDGDELAEVLAGLGASVQALGELQTYTRKIADVAPEEVRVEADLMADSVEEQLDAAKGAASDPLGALASSLFSGLSGSGPTSTVNDYAEANCGEGI